MHHPDISSVSSERAKFMNIYIVLIIFTHVQNLYRV